MSDYKGPMPGETVEALRVRVAELERENARFRLLEQAAIRAVMEEAGGLTVAQFALKMVVMQRQRDALKQAVVKLWQRAEVAEGWHSGVERAAKEIKAERGRLAGELAEARGEIGRLDHVMKGEARLMERLAGTMDTD